MKILLPHFLLVKTYTVNKTNYIFPVDSTFFTELNQSQRFTTKDKRTILNYGKTFYWLKRIEYQDYMTISFVLDNFMDDLNYCNLILQQYFTKKAKDFITLD